MVANINYIRNSCKYNSN